ncbi:hypothetical protein MEG05_18805 [Vibrio aestuarianus]|uniref:hypothetical protein n=1 Tax=Vibrio aestuarianus TaxID=28171 RepID=UPI00237CFDEC|nr:hypothetical protein [Vibrio aestuarianus]MDE1316047.1 hypothetical protein [Vibrio aestuarianus]
MLYSTQRMGIRFCLDERGDQIDSKIDKDLTGLCRVCGQKIVRDEPFQLFQHTEQQCDHLVLSEVSERIANLIEERKNFSIPIDYRCTNSIGVEVLHCFVLVDNQTRPLIQLTTTDNQTIYLSIALEDSEVSNQQISELRVSAP